MKIAKEKLAEALKDLKPLWSDNAPQGVPSASHVAFRKAENGVELLSVNDVGSHSILLRDCSLSEEFSVSGARIYQIVRRVPTEELVVDPLTTNVRIESSDDKFSIKVRGRWEGYLLEHDTPTLSTLSEEDVVDGEMIQSSMERVSYAVDTEGAHESCQGIHLESRGPEGFVRIAATDGQQTAYDYLDMRLPPALDVEGGVLFPQEALPSINTFLEDDWVVDQVENHFWIGLGDDEFTFRPLADSITFPSIEQLVPDPTAGPQVDVNRKGFQEALRATELAVDDYSNRLNLDVHDCHLRLRSGQTEQGEGEYLLEAQTPSTDMDVAAYNVHYVQDAVQSFDSEHLSLYFTDAGGNTMLAITPANDASSVSMIVPMRVQL